MKWTISQKHNLSKLSDREKKLDRPILVKEIKSVAENLFTKKYKAQIIL